MAEVEVAEREEFRQQARAWLKENFPVELTGVDGLIYQGNANTAAEDPTYQLWRERVATIGWGVPTWPRRFGGADLDQEQARIIGEEMLRIRAFNPIRSYGTMMLGPTLLEYGTEAQKLQHLPAIADHTKRWCQGFSEPGAGSDLAALETKCVDMGDHWLVSGQKIWTSGADQADWCFCLVRTDSRAKQGGISFLLIDMKSQGIEARPIVLISGSTHFCEVFFNDVKVPKENMVGAVNQGWTVAKRLLQFERDNLSVVRNEATSLAPLAHEKVGTDPDGRIADPDLRQRLIRNAMRSVAYAAMVQRLTVETKAGVGLATRVSSLKNLWSGIAQERTELHVELLGADGLGWGGDEYAQADRNATRAWLHSRAFSIYGGTYEVQNNIAAKRSLGLPDA